jgi:hypothetical protein
MSNPEYFKDFFGLNRNHTSTSSEEEDDMSAIDKENYLFTADQDFVLKFQDPNGSWLFEVDDSTQNHQEEDFLQNFDGNSYRGSLPSYRSSLRNLSMFNIESEMSDLNVTIKEEKPVRKIKPSKSTNDERCEKDFQFTAGGIIFKADLIIYEQERESFYIDVNNHNNTTPQDSEKLTERVTFDHFLKVKGCKL